MLDPNMWILCVNKVTNKNILIKTEISYLRIVLKVNVGMSHFVALM